MKSKSLLFAGIILLLIGILIRKLTHMEVAGLILIIIGVTCKTVYIIKKAKSGEYQPGKELLILIFGLILFLTGLYFKSLEFPIIKPIYLIISGIVLKISFIIRFIQVTRSTKNK
ncbi:hypothetical protein [Seonamhaeicola maritimus]|uniref:Uncharacterized protein n=1 Tax=Seonamhaeicola maritimus TaxID=2591822 RepID=A0A5C7GGN8_9FLAO|nr:hypothetical protein [Seonamhaeicola maritimus]TXG36748.1 hypothetical protein FUA22_09205 [Seonamhaeicola maritimus]